VTARLRNAVAGAVNSQVAAMHVSQIGQSSCALNAERGSRGVAQFVADEHGAVIRKADDASVEGRIPQCREEQAIVHIEPLRASSHSAQGTKWEARSKARIGNAGDWAAAAQ
jgi:hypothetical protein